MFLASILVCYIEKDCEFHSSKRPYPNEFVCNQAMFNTIEYYKSSPKVLHIEARCFKWGSLTGGEIGQTEKNQTDSDT